MYAALLTLPALLFQDPEAELVEARRLETARVQAVDRAANAVCSVMGMKSAGGGSGVIIDPAGFVLTNYHVVGEPKKDKATKKDVYADMKVGLPDGRLYRAKVLGIDPGSDLAILYLGDREDGKPWPFTPIGNSEALLVGETVFAMGNPFLLATDFTPTVTWGIVSGTHRYQGGQGNRMLVYPDCIQVDAPVNPGNSGGPLFNENGEVVGINGRITLRDRGRVNTGVGFAIAAGQIQNFLADMMAGRHTEHGTLDLNGYFMNSPSEKRRGVFVQAVFADSKARDLGVDLGDELVRFNGSEIRSANQLATMVGVLPEQAWVTLDYRKRDPDGGHGKVERIYLQLNRLDTGSSFSTREDWFASKEVRAKATAALTRPLAGGAPSTGRATMTLHDVRGRRTLVRRLGDQLRADMGDVALVRTAEGEGFKVVGDGTAEPLSPEEQAWLDRTFATCPLLFSRTERHGMLKPSLLHGGVFVHGRAAYAFEIPGEGVDRHVYLYADGEPAGWRTRDPLAKADLEYRIPHPARVADAERRHAADSAYPVPTLRVVRDGKTMEPDWSVQADHEAAVNADLFRRPQ